jgi:hypothetical protein
MQFIPISKLAKLVILALGTLCAVTLPTSAQSSPPAQPKGQACPNDDSDLKLPPGFCATIFADEIGHARHMVVAPSGVVYVNTWSGEYYGNDTPHAGGFLVALQDTSGGGKANVVERFGETVQSGGAGGTGIGVYKGSVFAEINDRIVRYSLSAGSPVPKHAPVAIVSGLPLGGDHPMHPFIIDDKGSMYVDVATARSWNDFIDAFNTGFVRQFGAEWNGNLDSFNDYLFWPDEHPYRLVVHGWKKCFDSVNQHLTWDRRPVLDVITEIFHANEYGEVEFPDS